MAIMENHAEGEPDVEMNLMNGKAIENGSAGPDKHLDPKAQGARQKCMKKKIAIIILAISLFVSVTGNIIQAVPKRESQATVCLSDGCLHGWNRHGDWCYFVSVEQQDWDVSRSNCSSYSASMVTLEHEEEWDFIKKKDDEYWISLRRENADQPWKWPNGSSVTQFDVKNSGLCGYVAGDTVSSTNCDNVRHWICRKPVRDA